VWSAMANLLQKRVCACGPMGVRGPARGSACACLPSGAWTSWPQVAASESARGMQSECSLAAHERRKKGSTHTQRGNSKARTCNDVATKQEAQLGCRHLLYSGPTTMVAVAQRPQASKATAAGPLRHHWAVIAIADQSTSSGGGSGEVPMCILPPELVALGSETCREAGELTSD